MEFVVPLNPADVRERLVEVAHLHRLRVDHGLPAGLLLEQFDYAHQIFAAAVSDIVQGMRVPAAAGFQLAAVRSGLGTIELASVPGVEGI